MLGLYWAIVYVPGGTPAGGLRERVFLLHQLRPHVVQRLAENPVLRFMGTMCPSRDPQVFSSGCSPGFSWCCSSPSTSVSSRLPRGPHVREVGTLVFEP
jgi:hypothetical protein